MKVSDSKKSLKRIRKKSNFTFLMNVSQEMDQNDGSRK